MPVDSRRLPTPDVTYDPFLFTTPSDENLFISDEGQRSDGRHNSDLRDLHLRCGLITQATGSSYCEMGNTKVICAVYGPKDIEQRDEFQMKGKLKCETKFAPFSCRKRKDHLPSPEEQEMSEVITQALMSAVCLHKFPKSQIDVYLTVLDNDGSALAASTMAASLALADASIDMYDIITACSVRIAGKDSFIVDPCLSEEQVVSEAVGARKDLNYGMVTVGLLPTINQVSAIVSSGHLSCDVLSDATEVCITSAQCRYDAMRTCLTEMMEVSKSKVSM